MGLSPSTANLLGGLAGMVAGGFPTPTSTNSTTSSMQSGVSNTSQIIQQLVQQLQQQQQQQQQTQTTTPNLSPNIQQLMNTVGSQYNALATPDLTGYQAQQTQGINNTANLQTQNADASMAARGLSTSPIAQTTDNNIQNQRFSNITNLAQSIPLLKNQLMLSNLGAAGGFVSSAPKGSTTSGTGTTTGTTTGSTSTTGNNQSNVQSGSSGTTTSQQLQQQGGGVGGALGAIGSILPLLFLS